MKNLVLFGFMGSGKTTIGRLAAAELKLNFVDVDHWIEKKEGKTIAQIFETQGESGFRDMESRVITELSTEEGNVLATGGGAVLKKENVQKLSRKGILIHLHVDAATAFARTKTDSHRPLLKDKEPQKRIEELLTQRMALYAKLPYQVQTSSRSTQEVLRDVLRIYRSATRNRKT